MFKRKLYTHDQLVAFFDRSTMQCYWEGLVKEYPATYKVVWETLPSRLCQGEAARRHWDNSELYLRLREGLSVLHWCLGADVATELIYIGQVPVLAALLGLREDVVDQPALAHVDLQTHAILKAVKKISDLQVKGDQDILTIASLNDLSIGPSYRDLLVESYIRVGVSQQSQLKERLRAIGDRRGIHQSVVGGG